MISDNAGGYECTAMNTLANGTVTTDRAMFTVVVGGEYHTHTHIQY